MSDGGGFTRRDLVRGSLIGAIAVGTGAKAAPAGEPGSVGPGPAPLQLTVNGTVQKLSVEPRVTLVSALRDRLGLTGTKAVCERGACGACTVLVDGAPTRSCLVFAVSLEGAEIITVEGCRSADGGMGPVQQAFRDCHALQCGFCTPGFITTVTAFLDENAEPTAEQAREAISGNLCRCTGYQNIVAAVGRAAELRAEETA